MKKFDLIVAGAGAAGLSLTLKSVEKGLKVALVDIKKRVELGHDWSDSIEEDAFNNPSISLLPSEETSKPYGLRILSPLKSKEYKIPYSYKIVDRKLLENRLLNEAIDSGVELFDEVEAVRPLQDEYLRCSGLSFKKNEESVSLESSFLADCTGISGSIRNQFHGFDFNTRLKKEDTSYAYREVHEWNGKSDINTDWLTYIYSVNGGYQWFNYESNSSIDVGCGIQDGKGYQAPDENVKNRIEEDPTIGKYIRGGGGKIPVRMSPPCLYSKGLLLVGDSAFQAIPTSGCGAGNAIKAGLMAGEALSRSEFSPDERGYIYQKEYFRKRGADLAYYDVFRRKMQSCTPKVVDWLMKKEILGKTELWGSIHGIYQNTATVSQLSKVFRGLLKIPALLSLQNTIILAEKVRDHLLNIPDDSRRLQEWQNDYLILIKRVEASQQ